MSDEQREQLRNADPRVLAQLFDAAFPEVHAFIARMLTDLHTAEDVTQECFLRIQRGLASYRPERPLRPWIFAIAANSVRDHLRSSLRHTRIEALDAVEGAGEELEDPGLDPLKELSRSERAERTLEAIRSLPEPLRAVVLLRHLHELAFGEIAEALEISPAAARQRFTRALSELRSRISAGFAPEDSHP